jgi:hypothetical protein
MNTLNGFRKHIEYAKMPNGKLFSKCSRIELYDIITEAMQFIVKQDADLKQLAEIAKAKEQKTLKYKIKKLFRHDTV